MAMELVGKLPYDHPYRWDGTKFGSGKLWRPSDLGADLALWFDAEDTNTITLNGSTVSQWNDKSGKNRNASQPTASLQPTYISTGFNGKPTLQTDGNDILEIGVTSLGRNVNGLTCAIVGVHPSGLTFNSNANEFYISTGTTSASTRFGLTPNPSASTINRYGIAGRRLDADGYSTVSSSTDSLANRGNPWIRVAQRAYSAGVANHWTNGAQDMTNEVVNAQTAGNTSDTNALRAAIFGGVSTLPAGSQLCEIVLTHSTMSPVDRQKLEGYLAWKWNLVTNLPAAHPYKTQPPFVIDPEAQRYLRAVEAVDGEPLEDNVRLAVNDFVVGCKEDGIWNAIKASCILAGARTLGGALVPLKGTAPTNFNFVAGDYNRETGLVGNGSTKYLNTNRNNNADPQNSNHNAVFASFVGTYDSTVRAYIADTGTTGSSGTNAILQTAATGLFTRNRSAAGTATSLIPATGLIACSRSVATSYVLRNNQQNTTINVTSESPTSANVLLFRRGDVINADYTNARLAFYSIGESLDLAKLDARVSTLNSHLAFAINTGLYAGDYSAETIAYVNAGYAAGGTLE